MKYLIITFKSRNDAMLLFNILKSKNVICSVINTPKIIGSTCSLSIKTNINTLNIIRSLISPNNKNIELFIYEPQLNFASKL